MECIGAIRSGVVSLCSDVSGGPVVVSLSESGAVHVWDTRARQANPPSFTCPPDGSGENASEICYFPEAHRAVTLCGEYVHVFDLRSSPSTVVTYEHQAEVVQCLPRTPADVGTDELLLVDEDGFMFPFQVSCGRPRATLSRSIFGRECDLSDFTHPLRHDLYGFGSLTNYCSGIATLGDAAAGVAPHLLALGMDSVGALYTAPGPGMPFELPPDEAAETVSAQMVNPPLPNCVAARDTHIAVGKANGVYSLFQLDSDGELNEQLLAPGDAMNGLIYVDWLGSQGTRSLLTLSLCGDITVWGVGDFLTAPVDEDDEEADALPEVYAALSLRDFLGPAGAAVYANTCCGLPQSTRYVLGDTRGHILLFDASSTDGGAEKV